LGRLFAFNESDASLRCSCNPPSFSTDHGEHSAIIDIRNLDLWSGYLPPRVLGLVIEWAAIHQDELVNNWEKVVKQETLLPINPLV